jgi:hypothetical protein
MSNVKAQSLNYTKTEFQMLTLLNSDYVENTPVVTEKWSFPCLRAGALQRAGVKTGIQSKKFQISLARFLNRKSAIVNLKYY